MYVYKLGRHAPGNPTVGASTPERRDDPAGVGPGRGQVGHGICSGVVAGYEAAARRGMFLHPRTAGGEEGVARAAADGLPRSSNATSSRQGRGPTSSPRSIERAMAGSTPDERRPSTPSDKSGGARPVRTGKTADAAPSPPGMGCRQERDAKRRPPPSSKLGRPTEERITTIRGCSR